MILTFYLIIFNYFGASSLINHIELGVDWLMSYLCKAIIAPSIQVLHKADEDS